MKAKKKGRIRKVVLGTTHVRIWADMEALGEPGLMEVYSTIGSGVREGTPAAKVAPGCGEPLHVK